MLSKLLSLLPGFFTRPWVQILAYGLALGSLSIFLAESGGVTNDSWWHLRTGKELWEGTFSFHDLHNWIVPGAYWPAHELGFEWLLYGLWLLGGESFVLMGLLNVLLVLGSFILLLPPKHLRERFNLQSNILVPILIFLAGYSLLGFVQIRAQAISFFLFALTVRLILLKKPYWIPLVFLAWVYLHGSVFVGVALMGTATLILIGRWLLDRSEPSKFKDALNFSIAGLLSLVGTCLSPLGFGLWEYFLAALQFGDTEIGEWQPLYSDPRLLSYGISVIVLLALAAWRLWRWKNSWELIFLYSMSVFFFLYSLNILRVYSNLVLIALPILYLAAMSLFKGKTVRTEKEILFKRIAISLIAFLSVIAMYYTAMVTVHVLRNGSHDPFEHGGVAEMLRSEQCKDSLWNDYDTGSYLLWFMPDIKVSVDSRFDLYPKWVMEAAGVIVPEGESADPTQRLNKVLEKYDIRCMVMTRADDTDALEERGLRVLAENLDMVVFEIPENGIPRDLSNE